jgi:hypothetical protein
MEQHLKILAVLNIVLGALGVIAALVILIFFGGLAGIAGTDPDWDADLGAAVLGLIGGVASFIVMILSAPTLIAGIGLLNYSPWSKTLAMIVSALHLFNIPFGTALGIYGLWVLSRDETAALMKVKHPA